jgi:large subunit ribosomal protein L6
MSRIGKNPLPIPDGVKVALSGDTLTVEGTKGKLECTVHPLMQVAVDDGAKQITVAPKPVEGRDPKRDRLQRALWGTTWRQLQNMIVGVTQGYEKAIQVVGVGYTAAVQGNQLTLKIGFANEITMEIPDGISASPPEAGNVTVPGAGAQPCMTVKFTSCDKQLIGQFTARLRDLRPPEPYRGKGVRYVGEQIRHKAGKAAAGTT